MPLRSLREVACNPEALRNVVADGPYPRTRRAAKPVQMCSRCKPHKAPRCSSEECWYKYFRNNAGKAATMQTLIDGGFRDRLVARMGEKYVKHYERFRRGR